jgi:Domain of unknown function (DUF6457)
MLDWLEEAQHRLEAGLKVEGTLDLSPADVEALLELARTAAHESGERTNAPLVAYLVGVAHGRNPEASLRDLISAALGSDPTS